MKSKSELVDIYKKIVTGDYAGWVLFARGTCVVISQIRKSIVDDAVTLLKTNGPVVSGTPSGDFGLVELKDHLGWVVTGDHPDILNYVAPDEAQKDRSDRAIGLIGRNKRDMDGKELIAVHVEEKG